jgi:hypothetical protein
MSNAGSLLEQYGAVHLNSAISKELAQFLTHVLLRAAHIPQFAGGDGQIPNAKSRMDHEVLFETLLESMWPKFETVLGFELLPTYAYARLYNNGDVLEKHIDRPACEISATVQLGRSHHYAWPIYMGKKRYDMAEGDAVVYRGCDIEHWRDNCDGPDGYYSGQVFLHFVRKDGPYAEHACDFPHRNPWTDMFVKHRPFLMENK